MTSASPDLAARARDIALTLTGWPSVTGTPEEAAFSGKLAHWLGEMQAGSVWTEALPGDALGRSNVFLLKKGAGRRTVALAGHFDVVPIEGYGGLKHLAFSPAALQAPIIARLEQGGESPLALADLKSGDYLPGRGLLDMKAGLAAGIAALEAYRGDGNLLLVATPDEEDRSAGMRAAAPSLAAIAERHGLDIALVINLDAISDQGDGSLGQTVAMGSIGKQLLTAFVVGREAHACYPQDGVNAAYLAAELVTELEGAPELAEQSGAEVAAPPTVLHAKDMKTGYNVTTPGQAWVYWNTLQHRRSGGEVLDIALALARRAMERARQRTGREIPVLTYAQLAHRLSGEARAALEDEQRELGSADLPERAKRATLTAWRHAGLAGPAVVLGFGSIPYPAVALGDAAMESRIAAIAGEFGAGTIGYFPGISDMSFVGKASGDMGAIAANTPMRDTGFRMPQPAGYPCINIGPWGRDYHHWLERLYTPYAFGVLPRLILKVAESVLKDD